MAAATGPAPLSPSATRLHTPRTGGICMALLRSYQRRQGWRRAISIFLSSDVLGTTGTSTIAPSFPGRIGKANPCPGHDKCPVHPHAEDPRPSQPLREPLTEHLTNGGARGRKRADRSTGSTALHAQKHPGPDLAARFDSSYKQEVTGSSPVVPTGETPSQRIRGEDSLTSVRLSCDRPSRSPGSSAQPCGQRKSASLHDEAGTARLHTALRQ